MLFDYTCKIGTMKLQSRQISVGDTSEKIYDCCYAYNDSITYTKV